MRRQYSRTVDRRGKVSRESKLEATLQALGTHFKEASALVLAGRPYALSELAQMLEEELDALNATQQIEAERKSIIARERAIKARNEPILVALENVVRGLYGGDVSVLSAFALSAPKKPKKTPEVKVEGAKKAKATRRVRRTMGRKQKKSVKG